MQRRTSCSRAAASVRACRSSCAEENATLATSSATAGGAVAGREEPQPATIAAKPITDPTTVARSTALLRQAEGGPVVGADVVVPGAVGLTRARGIADVVIRAQPKALEIGVPGLERDAQHGALEADVPERQHVVESARGRHPVVVRGRRVVVDPHAGSEEVVAEVDVRA